MKDLASLCENFHFLFFHFREKITLYRFPEFLYGVMQKKSIGSAEFTTSLSYF